VPIVTHLHGNAGVQDNSDGYTEAWYMPDATNLGAYAKVAAPAAEIQTVRTNLFTLY
jgi:hypothetical protein